MVPSACCALPHTDLMGSVWFTAPKALLLLRQHIVTPGPLHTWMACGVYGANQTSWTPLCPGQRPDTQRNGAPMVPYGWQVARQPWCL